MVSGSGRKAMSVEAIIANGNKSHLTKAEIEQRKAQEQELKKLGSDKIRPPKWLDKDAKKIFKDIVTEMEVIGILANVDVYGLAIVADCMQKYIKCTIALHTEPMKVVNVTKNGEVETENPTVRTQLKYAEMYNRLSANYGLSPAARLKIIQQNTPQIDDEESEFESEYDA